MELSSELVQLQAGFIVNIYFHYYLNLMVFGKFMELIYFNSFTISMNFLDHLVTNMRESVLKD